MPDYASDHERAQAALLGQARQDLAAAGTGYIPRWADLGDDDRAAAMLEARNWLRAAASAGLLAAPEPGTRRKPPMPDIPYITVLADGTEVCTKPIAYLVTAWPEDLADHPDAATWCLTVSYRGGGLWSVTRGHGTYGPSLSADGRWSFGRSDDEDIGQWRAQHRFPLDRALEIAREWAPKIRMVGLTTLECIAWHREQEAKDRA